MNMLKITGMRFFEHHGITKDQLELRGPSSFDRMLLEYQEVDVVLDSLAYSGGTTTMHALWMGVPVITILGELYHHRMSASILYYHGMSYDVLADDEGFVERCRFYAQNVQDIRHQRKRLFPTPSEDGMRYAQAVDSAIAKCFL